MLPEKNLESIDRILDGICQTRNKWTQGWRFLIGFFLIILPFVGDFFLRKLEKAEVARDLGFLDELIKAFELGYVPGGGKGYPKHWSHHHLFIGTFEKYHPDNAAYQKELAEDLQRRLDSDASVPLKKQAGDEYGSSISVDAILDLEGLSPPMKHRSRCIQYGNRSIEYWTEWAKDLKVHINKKLEGVT